MSIRILESEFYKQTISIFKWLQGSIGRRRGMNGHQNHYNHNGSQRPHSEMIHSPMSEIHPVGPTSISRNGMPPRPNSVLEDPSYFPPLSPPPDFHSGKDILRYGRNTRPNLIIWSFHLGTSIRKAPGPFGWTFWTMTFYNLKKFTSRSI